MMLCKYSMFIDDLKRDETMFFKVFRSAKGGKKRFLFFFNYEWLVLFFLSKQHWYTTVVECYPAHTDMDWWRYIRDRAGYRRQSHAR